MPKRPCALLLLIFCLHSYVRAQTSETDSLINLLNRSAEDTNKVHLYWKTGASILYQDPKRAIPYFKQGTALALKLNFISGIERCYNATSLSFSVNAKYDSALIYINYAVIYAVKAGNIKRLALAYLNRADVYNNLNNYSAALKDCDTAMQYAEQAGSNDAIGRIYSIMNGVYSSLNQYPQALAILDKSDKFFEKVNNRQMIAMNYSERAEILSFMNEPGKAVPYYKKAIVLADSLNDIENLCAYQNGLSTAYIQLKKYKEAEAASTLSLHYAEQTGNTRQQAVIYDTFYSIEMAQNNAGKAIEYGLKAYRLIRNENDPMREYGIVTNLAEAYHQSGNLGEAYKFLKISRDLNDSLVKEQFTAETAKLQTTFEVTQKDKEIQLLNKDKELQRQRLQKQRLLMMGALLLALLALTGIWLLVNRSKLRQRMKELELRNQIAADLHDEVGSSLSSIHMLSQIATQKQDTDATQKDILSRMSTNAKETMDKMGDIVWMIKPGESEASSLKQRMERFAYEICSSKNIDTMIQLDDLEKLKLTMEQRKNLYLIFKEAVNNAVKYSGTEKMEITVSEQNKQLVLIVRDHGRGFNPETTGQGNGLDNMRNRATELKGELELLSEEGRGTIIRLSIPV